MAPLFGCKGRGAIHVIKISSLLNLRHTQPPAMSSSLSSGAQMPFIGLRSIRGNAAASNTVDVSLATPAAGSDAAGATLTGQTLRITLADGTNAGAVSTTTQTLAGVKTFVAA